MLLPFLKRKRVAALACVLPVSRAYSVPRIPTPSGNSSPLHCSSWRTPRGAAAMASMAMSAKGGGAGDGGGSRAGVVWFKWSDLRLEDHEPLALAHRDCSEVAHVFCLDDRWFGRTR